MSSTSATPGTSEAPLLQRYGNYLLVRKLTEGGMAEIFLAKHLGAEGFERDLVIKRLLPQLSDVQEFVRMFLDEARLAARLSHPNIVQISDLGQAEGRYFIAMEYLAGEDFSSTLRTLALAGRYTPLPVVLQVLSAAARGLHHAHEMQDENGQALGIVHRDISPSNLHLTYQGQVKVLDFGIAWAQTRLTKTQAGVVKGKYSYMAPEQARGEQVDRRADVYSLGVSLYEALTHIRPLVREHDLAMLNAVLSGEYPPPRDHRPDLPAALEAITLKAMALDPAERYPTAHAFADALDAALPDVGGPMDLGRFLIDSFGEARFVERTRIPSLATLTAAVGGAPSRGQPASEPLSGPPTVAARKTPVGRTLLDVSPVEARGSALPEALTDTGSGRGARWRWPLVGVLVGLGVLGGGTLLLRPSGELPATVTAIPLGVTSTARGTEPVEPPVAEQGSGTAPGTLEQAPGKTGSAASADVGGANSAVGTGEDAAGGGQNVVKAGSAAGVENTAADVGQGSVAAGGAKASSRPARPASKDTLSVADIQEVVTRAQSRFFSCFETHKAELPADSGELTLRIRIQSSGRADGAVEGALGDSQVGRCVVRAVQRLRFPQHQDKELQAAFPLSWRVER